jgi:hypothetical protein
MGWWAVAALVLLALWLLGRAFAKSKKKLGPLNISEDVESVPLRAVIQAKRSAEVQIQPDAWDTGILRNTFDERELIASAEIDYIDSHGQATHRRIEISHFYPEQRAILAYCQMRSASRSFLTDRISEYVDPKTGEVVTDILGHLKALYAVSPKGSAEGVLSRRSDELTVLNFIARSSGSLIKRRKLVIASFLLEGDPLSTSDAVEAAVAQYEFTQNDFRAALRRLHAADQGERARLLRAVDELRGIGSYNEFVEAAAKVAHKQLGSPG